MPYEVQTPVFDGPFDLLLHLIVREQVDLYEISLTLIVDAYLAEIERDAEVDLDDEFALWEERDLLIARLLDCKTFKDAAGVLARMADSAARSRPRRAGPDERFFDLTPDLLLGIDAQDLRMAYLRAMTPKPRPVVSTDHIHSVRTSVTDAVTELVDELPRLGRVTFRRLTESFVERLEVVVRFLAVLELFKQGLVDLDQPAAFGEIEIVWTGSPAMAVADLAGIDSYEG